MPSFRAFFRSAAEARDAASAAVTKLAAAWTAAARAAGADAPEPTPVVGVSIEGITAGPSTPGLPDYWLTSIRTTAPDGRSEVAQSWMPREQAIALESYAGGTVHALHGQHSKIGARGRVAHAVQIQTTDAASLTTSDKLQDPATSKKYVCMATSIPSAGTWTVYLTEDDPLDTSEATHGTVLEFLAPPVEVNPLARVNSVKGFTVPPGAQLVSPDGKRYVVVGGYIQGDGSGLSGDLIAPVTIVRDLTDGLDHASAEVGTELTWVATPADVAPTAFLLEKHDKVVPAGAILRNASSTRFYEVTTETVIGDALDEVVPVKARTSGVGHNLTFGETLTFTSPPSGVSAGTVASSVLSAPYPQSYPSQIIGASIEWSSATFQIEDGRWCAMVFTQPFGS